MSKTVCNTSARTGSLPSTKEVCMFLSDYAAWLMGCGATCARIEKNIRRMSEAFGMESDMAVMPAHIHLSVWDKEHTESYSNIKRIHRCGISFNINTRLSKLSWDVADGRADFDKACTELEEISRTPPENQWLVLLLASLANAAFCRLFGGDAAAMLTVFVATLAGYRLKQIMLGAKADVRLTFFCSAFFSSVICTGSHLFGWGATPEIAIGTSVLYLIPGIPYINSVSDMLDGHYICMFGRLTDAAVLTACLSAGLCAGLLLMNLSLF